jgi:hypothetical protein
MRPMTDAVFEHAVVFLISRTGARLSSSPARHRQVFLIA